jgi:hypothetical protein
MIAIEQARGADILAVAGRLGAQLKRITTTERAGPCPLCGGRDTFAVNTARQLFVCRKGSSGGDVIAMVQHAAGLGLRDAVEFIIGDSALQPSRATALPVTPAKSDDAAHRKAEQITAIWREAIDPRGTLVETYLHGRELFLEGGVAAAIRFHPACPWREADDSIVRIPAMIAAFRDIQTDRLTGINRTRLSPEGAKIDRRMLGVAAACAVKLDADDTVVGGLHISEGVETAMTARLLGLRPTWALGSAGAVAAFPVLGGIECLTILAEHDPASARAVQACGERWYAAGREVLVNRPTAGKDLNDAIRMRP